MRSVSVLPFRFHRAAAVPVSPEATEFYRHVTRSVFGGEYHLDPNALRETIPLSSEMNVNPDLLRLAALRLSNSWGAAAAAVVELTSASSYSLPTHHVINGVLGFIDADRARFDWKYVVLIPMMFAKADVVMGALQAFLDQDILGLLADNGDHLGLSSFFRGFHAAEYADALQAARKPKMESLRNKLIRFPGHFFSQYRESSHALRRLFL